MKGGDHSSAGKPLSRASGPQDTNVDIPGYKRMDFPDGSYVLEGQHGVNRPGFCGGSNS